MTVDLRPLRDERGATMVVACHETVPSQIAEVSFAEPVEGRLVLTNLGSVLRIEGRLETHVELTCDRCARPFPYRLEARVLEDLDWTEGEGALAIEGGMATLDLQALAREQLLLALPMVVRCDEACGGLCDRCGAPRGECNCREEQTDPRLAPLARWRRDPQ